MRTYVSLEEAVLLMRHRYGDAACWPWIARERSALGYGLYSFAWEGKRSYRVAHAAVYELLVDAVPIDKQLHHRCGNRGCTNPAHLQLVTPQEHGAIGPDNRPKKEHECCHHGHPYSADNRGNRLCKPCRAEYARAWYLAHRAEILAKMHRKTKANRLRGTMRIHA